MPLIPPLCNRVLAALLAFVASMSAPAIAQEGVAELVGDGIARFRLPGAPGPSDGYPSYALIRELPGIGAVPASFRTRLQLGTAPGGQPMAAVTVEPGTSLYGTGEIAGPLLRNGRQTVAWNTDAYAYKDDSASLYQSHPWVLGVRADGSAFGVLADTTYRCRMDLVDGIRFIADGPSKGFPVYVIERGSPLEVVTALTTLIGMIPMPPRWALGYHQCRYSYNPEARVREIAQGFRDRDIPCDVIWMDIDYMDEYRVFTFDQKQFPDPARLNSDLEAQGFRTIWMIDPGIKAEPGYSVFDSGTAGDHWVKSARGAVYRGEVWPGQCVFPDFTRPETRQWWAGLYKDFLATGIDGVWNDMNEPAVFNVASKTMPEDNVHRGGGGIAAGPHARFHNLYGMLMAMGTRDAVAAANPDHRPFVLTRAGYIGSQRYAATWTGDNSAEWDDLEASVPMILNLGMSGQPLCGPDIGGFNGNGDGPMFARWMGVGALFPFARGHTGKGNINKEPWAFDAAVEKTCRLALQRRYRLMPYLYTLFHQASTIGTPVMRPVFFADPIDPALRSEDDAFLLGGDVLVVPRLTPQGDRALSLPRGVWNRFELVGSGGNADLPELRLRAGAIIPVGPVMEFTGERPLDPLTLLVCLDENGRAEGLLYEDAGDGWGFQKGEHLTTRYVAERAATGVRVSVASADGSLARPRRKLIVQVAWGGAGDGTLTSAQGQDGEPVVVPVSR